MTQFRVETVYEKTSNRYFIELYLKDGDLPIAVGRPIYFSHEHAMADAVEMLKKAMPSQPITTWREQ